MGSHGKPLFKSASQELIPALSDVPPFREGHSRRCSRLWRLQSTADLSTPRPDRHAACKVPRSASADSSGRPAWDDRTQITYPRPGLEFFFSRPFRSVKKEGKAGKKVKKGPAESEVKTKGEARDSAEPLRRVPWYSSVPDLTLLASEPSSRQVPEKETCKAGATGKKESFLEWFLDRYGIQKQQARRVACEQQGLQEMCKSLDIMPLPKDDSAPHQTTEKPKKTKPEPESHSALKGRFSKTTKAGPEGSRKGVAASMERHLSVSRFSPRPNKQGKELEKKPPVKRNILANVQRPHGNSTNLGGSRLRRSLSMQSVVGAGSVQKLKSSTTKKPAARPPSANKENK